MIRLKNNVRAFTLVELMVVIALIALLVMLTMTHTAFMHRALLRTEVEKLYVTCIYLQRLAMVTNKKQTLVFDLANNAYTFNGHKATLPDAIVFGFLPHAKGPPSDPVKPITGPVTFIDTAITFDPAGIIQPGTVYLADKNRITMYALSCSVSQVSFLRKYRYDNKWQLTT